MAQSGGVGPVVVDTPDRWIAATARYVGVPFVSYDGVFVNAPGIELLTLAPAVVTEVPPTRKRRP